MKNQGNNTFHNSLKNISWGNNPLLSLKKKFLFDEVHIQFTSMRILHYYTSVSTCHLILQLLNSNSRPSFF